MINLLKSMDLSIWAKARNAIENLFPRAKARGNKIILLIICGVLTGHSYKSKIILIKITHN